MEDLLGDALAALSNFAGQSSASSRAVGAAAGSNEIAAWIPAFRAFVNCLGLLVFVHNMEPRRDGLAQAPRARLGYKGETLAHALAFAGLCLAMVAVRVYGLRFYLDLPCVVGLFALYTHLTRCTAWSGALYTGIVTFLCGDLAVAVANSIYRHAPAFSGPLAGLAIEGLYAALMLGLCLFVRRWSPTNPEAGLRPAGIAALLLALLPYLVIRSSNLLYRAEGSDALTMESMLLLTIAATFGAVLANYGAMSADSERLRRLQLEMEMNERQRRYQVRKETMSEVNRRYHDLVSYARTLEAAGSQPGSGSEDAAIGKSLAERLTEGLTEESLLPETGSPVLDMLLWERGQACRKEGIRFIPQIDAPACMLAGIDGFDMHAIVGNALDNAIEASRKLANEELREIRCKVSAVGEMLFVKVENHYSGELCREGNRADGRLLTAKDNKTGAHGHGIENIRRTLQRHGGTLEIEAANGLFCLTALIPVRVATD